MSDSIPFDGPGLSVGGLYTNANYAIPSQQVSTDSGAAADGWRALGITTVFVILGIMLIGFGAYSTVIVRD